MKKNTINFIIDVLLLVVMVAVVLTGFILYFILPSGQGRGHSLTLWGMSRHQIGDIHFYLAVTLTTLTILHIVLHWAWVCTTVKNTVAGGRPCQPIPPKHRIIYGIIFVIVLVGISIALLLWMNRQVKSEEPLPRRGQGRQIHYD